MKEVVIDTEAIRTARGLVGTLLNLTVHALSGGKLDEEGVKVGEFFVNEFRARLGGIEDAGKRAVAITKVEGSETQGQTILEHSSGDKGKAELEAQISATAQRRRSTFVSRFGVIKITPILDTRDIDTVIMLAEEAMDNHVKHSSDSEELFRESFAMSNVMSGIMRALIHRF